MSTRTERKSVVVGSARPGAAALDPKFRRPGGGHGSVSRARLVGRLRAARSSSIVSIMAPAGFGKTLLLAAWDAADRRPFAWVTLDRGDNDPSTLVRSLALALRRIEAIDDAALADLTAGRSTAALVSGRALGLALSSTRRPVVLVLDDAHQIGSGPASAMIDALLAFPLGKSQVVLSGRSWPSDSLAAHRPRGLLFELGADDLAMDESEAQTMFGALDVPLDEDDARTLVDKTEGWPVALWLAAGVMAQDGVPKQAVASFGGDERSVSDYLSFEFLSEISHPRERFLERTAVLDRMSGPLCDAVLGTTGSAAVLEALDRDNLLVVPLDRNRGWYRYQRMLREMLLHRLESRDPRLVQRLRLRAADHLERDGSFEEALAYAVSAEDTDRVARIVAAIALPAYSSGRLPELEAWLSWLEERGAIESHPPLAAIAAWFGAIRGRPADADRWAEAAERSSFRGSMPDGSTSIDPWLALLRSMFCRDGAEQMQRDAEIALDGLAMASPFRTTAMLKLGMARWLQGDTPGADALLEDMVELGLEHGAKGPVCIAMAERALFAIERGDWEAARSMTDEARRFVQDLGLDGYVASTVVYAATARIALQGGDVGTAEADIAKAQRLRPLLTRAMPYLAVQTRLELARAMMGLSDPAGARTLLREVGDILRRRPRLGCLVEQAAELRARLRTVSGGTPGASTLTSAELRLLPNLPTYLSFREIGEHLHLSPHTVKTQAISIYRKLGVTSRAGAVERAADLGLLSS